MLLFSHQVLSDSLWPHELQHARLPCPLSSPWVCSNSCPLNQWYHSNHLILCCPLPLLPYIFPSIRIFASGGQRIELQLQHQSFQWIFRVDFLKDWLVWCPCRPRDSQKSCPAPHFKSTKSLALSLLNLLQSVNSTHLLFLNLCWMLRCRCYMFEQASIVFMW